MTDFEQALGEEGSPWHEYNLDVAREAVIQLSGADWQQLRCTVASRPAYWQERCAEALDGAENDESATILIGLLRSPHRLVASIAATELHNRSVRVPMALEGTLRDLLAYLENNRGTRSEDVRLLLDNLK